MVLLNSIKEKPNKSHHKIKDNSKNKKSKKHLKAKSKEKKCNIRISTRISTH
jgi:hypothetical protein